MSKLLTILTICKNSEKTIKDCLCSSIGFGDVEHLVIDGKSNDETVSIVEDLIIERPHISLFKKANLTGYTLLSILIFLSKRKVYYNFE